jgi:hypothetical protein
LAQSGLDGNLRDRYISTEDVSLAGSTRLDELYVPVLWANHIAGIKFYIGPHVNAGELAVDLGRRS